MIYAIYVQVYDVYIKYTEKFAVLNKEFMVFDANYWSKRYFTHTSIIIAKLGTVKLVYVLR